MRSGSRQRAEEGEGLRVQVHEQRGHHRGVRQKPASDHQDGLRQRAEARRTLQKAWRSGKGSTMKTEYPFPP